MVSTLRDAWRHSPGTAVCSSVEVLDCWIMPSLFLSTVVATRSPCYRSIKYRQPNGIRGLRPKLPFAVCRTDFLPVLPQISMYCLQSE